MGELFSYGLGSIKTNIMNVSCMRFQLHACIQFPRKELLVKNDILH